MSKYLFIYLSFSVYRKSKINNDMLFRNDNLSSKCGCIKDQGIPGIAPFYRVGFILIDNGEQMTKLTKVKSCIRLRLIILTSEYLDYFFSCDE